jgi:hypothetical protein
MEIATARGCANRHGSVAITITRAAKTNLSTTCLRSFTFEESQADPDQSSSRVTASANPYYRLALRTAWLDSVPSIWNHFKTFAAISSPLQTAHPTDLPFPSPSETMAALKSTCPITKRHSIFIIPASITATVAPAASSLPQIESASPKNQPKTDLHARGASDEETRFALLGYSARRAALGSIRTARSAGR